MRTKKQRARTSAYKPRDGSKMTGRAAKVQNWSWSSVWQNGTAANTADTPSSPAANRPRNGRKKNELPLMLNAHVAVVKRTTGWLLLSQRMLARFGREEDCD